MKNSKKAINSKANLALFDLDHTITFEDTFTNFIYYATSTRRLIIGKILLSPLLIGYKIGLIPATILRKYISKICFWKRMKTNQKQGN
jgi:phosphatidylglycerophosphatase C